VGTDPIAALPEDVCFHQEKAGIHADPSSVDEARELLSLLVELHHRAIRKIPPSERMYIADQE
jgi:hypothetical protein